MTWTYSNAPSTDTTDAVRLLIGQTSSGDEILITDEAIAWALTEAPTTYEAAAMSADFLAARYRLAARESERLGDTSVDWGDRAKKLDELASRLRRTAVVRSVTPFLGGQSVADRDARVADTDLRQPAFRTNQFDDTGTSFSTAAST